ncbi:DUF4397 domain-containing protein [Pedobacter gandavensis]|uniref:DUF4397 domain-containing protein n=1 Tax=Pedobacter gandavensis TaxID=2679963 RepID=A0ABR6ESQ1_9SPHI|nr:DUF4397 domain-containing protein [Pedobacter gandavensis]MBB2148296.1 DUF4397 domain-containing protein [Pedobacter gandavensis]
MNQIKYKFLPLFCLTAMLIFQACKKDKVNFEADNRVLTENRANSTARVINLALFNQVIANGDSLTSFITPTPTAGTPIKLPGTAYFPINGYLTKTWYIPQNLFNAQEIVKLDFMTRSYQSTLGNDINIEIKNDDNNPTDYFLMPTFGMEGQPDVVAVKRGVSAPSKPDHFKIRIVNLSGKIKNPAFNSSGSQEDLTGSVSLAYADGTLVNSQTNNISSSKQTSEYIEVPYGTYQFKVLMQDGRQMPALGTELNQYTLLDPPTSTIPKDIMNSTALTYAPIQTYQPGGIYTILIAPQRFNYLINENSETADTYQNSFQILNDNTAAVNNTYFRVQAANAWNTGAVSFKVDGKTIATDLGFGASGAYSNFIQGTHTVEALDGSGKVIASGSQVLRPAQNYTAWLYPDAAGAAKLILVANDLSGATYTGGPAQEDATYARNQYRYFFFKRFLNLSTGNPYLTFTLDNGQSIASGDDNPNAGVNLQPGMPLFERPYVRSNYEESSYEVMAYRSKPNVVPGVWASDIAVLKSSDFIANKDLYLRPGRALPVHEPGIYTVSLIGQSGTGTAANMKAKMIMIKHNK